MKATIGCLIGLFLSVCASAEPLLEGRVRLASGEPVADAQVRIFDMTDLRQGAIARALTDGTGYFALPLAALAGRALPERFALGPNYPNPFNPSTIIPYQLAASAEVRLEVFNLLGQHIATLVDGERAAGFHTAMWHALDGAGRAVGAGVYIYRMTVGVESQTGRMVLLDGQAGVSAAGAASVWFGVSGGGEGAQVYGLIVSGSGLVPYVDSSFRVESGMAPVELVVSSGQYSAGKATDDDCAFCDFFGVFNDVQEEEADETEEEEADETEEEEADETEEEEADETEEEEADETEEEEADETEEEEADETEEEEADETEEEEAETDSTSSEGGPDLIVQSPSVSAVMLTPGQEFTLNATVHNQGDEQAAATMLHYYRSNNATITSSDTEVGTNEIGVLDASATSAASITLTAPTGVSAEVGIYYGACVASVSGESNTDNNCSSAVKITVREHESPEEKEDETTQDGTDGDIASGDDEADEDTASDPSTRLLTHSGRGPRWSSDGQRIVFYSSRNGQSDIYSIDSDGKNEIRLTTHETGEWSPTWSSDGLRIAFVSGRDGHDSIHIMDSDGKNETRLTENNLNDGPPAWSPDGRRIAYVSGHQENRDIYVMDPDGSNKTRLTQHVDDWLPEWYPLAWSPDSQRIAFLSIRISIRNFSAVIYIMDADGSNKKRLTQNNRSSDPAWSPDGTSIAYSSLLSVGDGLYEIYIMDADGSNKQRLTWAEGYDSSPTWSPDGKRIAFVSERGGYGLYEIYVMDADGSNKQRLTYGAGNDGNVPSDLAWSPDPDSQRIVFERDRDEEIYIVDMP